jgi:hypothetical protein
METVVNNFGIRVGLFNPDKMRTTRCRYRGTAIPTPWPTNG